MPRRARHLIPTGLPRRGEVVAACAVAIVVAHLLLAQLTLVLAVIFAVAGKVSRWRPWWLLVPALAGLAWTLAVGPGTALAGFVAGASGILWHLGGGHLAEQAGHPFAGFGDARGWLPRQFPVALICGAAEAALAGWLDWLHTDEWAVRPPRPGLVAAARRALTASAIRAGTVATRDGCALGIVPATGAVAELRWAELADGALVVGTAAQEVTVAALQVVHAALRRRKPVIVFDLDDVAIVRALGTACAATGVPLAANGAAKAAGYAVQVAGLPGTGEASVSGPGGGTGADAGGASQLWGRGTPQEPALAANLGRVVRERSAALLTADTQELAARACADLTSLASDLRRIGVDGDAVVWVPRGDLVPAQALAALLRECPGAGLSVLIGTTSPAAARELIGLTGTALIFRVADQDLAASLAMRTGTRLLPASLAAAPGGQRPDPRLGQAPVPGPPESPGSCVAPGFPPHAAAPVAGVPPGPAAGVPPAPDLVHSPAVPASALLTLGKSEFVLAASSPRRRLIATGRMVPARLRPRAESPRGTSPRGGSQEAGP